MADLTGRTSYSYDNAGRQKSVIFPTGQSLTQTFDRIGRRTLLQEANGTRTTYAYLPIANGPRVVTSPAGETNYLGRVGGHNYITANYVSPTNYSIQQQTGVDGSGWPIGVGTLRLNAPYEENLVTYDTGGRVVPYCHAVHGIWSGGLKSQVRSAIVRCPTGLLSSVNMASVRFYKRIALSC